MADYTLPPERKSSLNDLTKAVRKRTRSVLRPDQQETLLKALDAESFPSRRRREELAAQVGCSPRTIQIWFQNQRQKARKQTKAARMVTPWSSPILPPPPPPPSPSLSYAGPERSSELNCLVDAAMEELCKVSITLKDADPPASPRLVPDLPPSRRRVRNKQERIEIKQDGGVSALLRALPASLLRSPKTKLAKSEQGSPKIKLLQPKSQPNSSSGREV